MTSQERKNFESIRDNVHGEPMTQVEVMKLALEALETIDGWLLERYPCGLMPKELEAITALRQAIEQAQKPEGHQEPVAWFNPENFVRTSSQKTAIEYRPLYTSPPPVTESHKRQPLTDEEIELLEWAINALSSFSAPDRPVGAWAFVYMPKLGELRNFVQKHKAAHGIKGEA